CINIKFFKQPVGIFFVEIIAENRAGFNIFRYLIVFCRSIFRVIQEIDVLHHFVLLVHRFSIQSNTARSHFSVRGNQRQQCCFPCTIPPEQAVYFPGSEFKINVGQNSIFFNIYLYVVYFLGHYFSLLFISIIFCISLLLKSSVPASSSIGFKYSSTKPSLRFSSSLSRAPSETNIPTPLFLYNTSSSTSSVTPFDTVI